MTLKGLFQSNWPRAIFVLVVYVVLAFAGTMSEYLFKYALNDLTQRHFSGFSFWIVMQTTAGIVNVVLLPFATYLFTKQIQAYSHQIRDEIMHHYYDTGSEEVSRMQNVLGNNMKLLADNYATPWIRIWSNIITMLMSVVVLLTLHWSLILATLIAGTIVMLLPKIMAAQTAAATQTASQKNGAFLEAISGWFGGLNELRRYSAFGRLKHELDQSSHTLAAANVDRQKRMDSR